MRLYRFFPDTPITRYRKSDSVFCVCVLLLWGLGLFTLYVCSPPIAERFFGDANYFVRRQLLCSVIGLAGLIMFSAVPIRIIRRFVFPLAVISFVFCVMALIPGIGSERKGASRWIVISHFISFQPSELVKFTIVLYLAHMFEAHAQEYRENAKEFVYPVAALLLFTFIIFCQRDLSTGIFVFCLGVAMFILSGASVKWLIPFAALAIPAAVVLVSLEEYRLMRILAFIFPDRYPLTASYQTLASARAVSSGGIWGTGIDGCLNSVLRVPEVHTDYIFTTWACAMGLLGVSLYFVLLAIFAWRGFRIALGCPNTFAAYAAFGATLSIFAQSFINLAVVSGAAPATGIPLPFFSSGGSSLIITMCMCGFIINASHCESDEESKLKTESKTNENRSIDRVVVEV